jgi:hypothetical protein
MMCLTRLYDEIKYNRIDLEWLGGLEQKDNLFPEIDYQVYRPAIWARCPTLSPSACPNRPELRWVFLIPCLAKRLYGSGIK